MKRIKKGLLSLTLGLVLSLGVGASIGVDKEAIGVKAETKTIKLENIGADESISSTANSETKQTTIGNYALNYYKCKKQINSNNYALFMTKNESPFISNKTDIRGTIKSITLDILSGAASGTSYNVAFGTSEFVTAPTSGVGAQTIAGGKSGTFDNYSSGTYKVANANYFCIFLGNSNNGQVLNITITYEGKSADSMEVDDSSTAPTSYLEYEYFNPTGLKIYMLYSDASDEIIEYNDKTKDSFTFIPSLDTKLKTTDTEISIKYTNVFYGSATCTLPITVIEDKVVSLSLSESSYEGKNFIFNDVWSNEGIIVKATKESGNVIQLDNNDENLTLVFDPAKPNSLLLSEVNVTATYTGITASVSKTLTGFNVVEKVQSTYDFAGNFATYAEGWGSGYGSRTLTNKDLGSSIGTNINFMQVSRQTGTSSITDRPVFKGSADSVLIDFNLTEAGYTIADVTITFAQWSNNELTLKLYEGAYSASSTAVSSLALKEDNLILSGKISGTRFQVTTSTSKQVGLTSIVITAIKSGTSVKEAEAWGKAFMTATNSICVNDDNSTALQDNWNSYKEAYEKLNDETKTLVKAEKGDSSTSATMLKQAVARYDHIITRYGSKLGVNANFIGREIKSTSGTHNILASADNGLTIAIIVIVSLVSVSSIIGATIVIRKRKTN